METHLYASQSESESESSDFSARDSSKWIRQGSKIVGVSVDDTEFRVGDAVHMNSGLSYAYIGLIYDFSERKGEKYMRHMWFMSYPEIKADKRRADMTPHELYLTPYVDTSPVDSIVSKATVLSEKTFDGSAPKKGVYFCRRGLQSRVMQYTDLFDWDLVFTSRANKSVALDRLVALIQAVQKPIQPASSSTPTKSASKRRSEASSLLDTPSKQRPQRQNLSLYTNDDESTSEVNEGLSDMDNPELGHETQFSTQKGRQRLQTNDSSSDDEGALDKDAGDEFRPRGTPGRRSNPVTPRKRARYTSLTPRSGHRKIYGPIEVTPLPMRIKPLLNSPYQRARAKLHVSAVPASLPCREREFRLIYDHVEQAIIDVQGICVYVSGTPGTGKTATVRRVIASLRAKVKAGDLDDFIFTEINGMKITDPTRAYSILWESISDQHTSPSQAQAYLNQLFARSSPSRMPVVVFMDELDQLVTKDQKVMYNFFNWPTLPHSQLIIITCANTMDLPERMLSNRVSSRMGLARIGFEPYTFQQLAHIIKSRIDEEEDGGLMSSIIDDQAIEFCARKVAAVTGDARRALDICRRAVQIAESSGEAAASVTTETVRKASAEMMASAVQGYLKSMPFASKLMLSALINRIRRTGVVDNSTVGDCVAEAENILSASSHEARPYLLAGQGGYNSLINWEDAFSLLVDSGIVILEKMRKGLKQRKLKLGISEADVHLALQEVNGLGGL